MHVVLCPFRFGYGMWDVFHFDTGEVDATQEKAYDATVVTRGMEHGLFAFLSARGCLSEKLFRVPRH